MVDADYDEVDIDLRPGTQLLHSPDINAKSKDKFTDAKSMLVPRNGESMSELDFEGSDSSKVFSQAPALLPDGKYQTNEKKLSQQSIKQDQQMIDVQNED